MALLEIKNLHARVAAPNGRDILKGVDLTLEEHDVVYLFFDACS